MLYRLALETGLRAGEIRSLTAKSFEFAKEGAFVTVSAAYSKRRREDRAPLRPGFAQEVRAWLRDRPKQGPVMAMPPSTGLAAMLRADLDAARIAWIDASSSDDDRADRERSDMLVYRDARDRVADFHALRHTFISTLARAGVAPKTLQSLARHSTITLTLDRYAHDEESAAMEAVSALPDLTQNPFEDGSVWALCWARLGAHHEARRGAERTGPSGGSRGNTDKGVVCSRKLEKAAVGFEPTMSKLNGFAIRSLRPLGHTASVWMDPRAGGLPTGGGW